MKKLVIVLFSVGLLALAGCGDKNASENIKEENTVTIFMPAEYLNADQKVDDWDPSLLSKKIEKEDGVDFQMTTSQYSQLKKDTKANLKAMFTQIEKSSKYEAVDSIDIKHEYDSIRLNVNKSLYKKMNREQLFQTMGLPIIHYVLLNKEKPDSFVIECEVFDTKTQEVIEVINLPMDLSNGVLN